MGGQSKKSTKKFEKNHLKDTIDKRKEFSKIKQRHQTKAKKQARKAADMSKSVANDDKPVKLQVKANEKADLSKMSVDDFFRGGIDLPEQKKAKASSKKAKGVPQANGKRKRDTEEGEDVAEASESINGSEDEAGSEEESDNADGLEAHKEDLGALAKNDPDFYKYLKENDAELLDFNEDADLSEVDQLSEEEAPQKKRKKSKEVLQEDEAENKDQSEVTIDLVKRWKIAMSEQHSLRAMRQVTLAFRAAAHVNSDDGKDYKYSVLSSEVYHELLVTALRNIPDVLAHHIPMNESAKGRIRIATDSKKFRTLTPLLKTHSASVHHLLEILSDAPTIQLTISSLKLLLPYILSFKKILRTLVKTAVNIWSDTSSTDETRIIAFGLIERLAVISDASLREAILKTTYQGLVRGSHITNIHTLPGINTMKGTAASLWSLDPNLSYTTAFTFIRQLAVHLRTSITQPTKDSYKTIYNWQYAHSLDFWSSVLSTHCSPHSTPTLKTPQDSPLHPLIYPLVQITLGALRLIPTPTYFPLRFHLTRSLLRLSRTTTTYIPLAPALLEVLSSPDLSKPPKPSTLPPLDFTITLRAPKTYLRTRVYQDGLGQQIQELLAEFFGCWAKNIAFPELVIPPTVSLKRWLKAASSAPSKGNPNSLKKLQREGKGNKNAKINAAIGLLVQKLGANAAFVGERRKGVVFGPGDRVQVDGFLRDVGVGETPLGAFVEGLRAGREERERVVMAGREADEGAKGRGEIKKGKGKGKKVEVNEEDGDGDMEGEIESEDE